MSLKALFLGLAGIVRLSKTPARNTKFAKHKARAEAGGFVMRREGRRIMVLSKSGGSSLNAATLKEVDEFLNGPKQPGLFEGGAK